MSSLLDADLLCGITMKPRATEGAVCRNESAAIILHPPQISRGADEDMWRHASPPEASPGISSPSHECRHLSGTFTYRRSLLSSSPLALALPSTFLRFCRTRETFSVIHSYVYVGRSFGRLARYFLLTCSLGRRFVG